MKIGILTFINTNNYGATLQAYATTRYLQSLKHEVILINVPLINPGGSMEKPFGTKVLEKISSFSKLLKRVIIAERKQAFLESVRFNLESKDKIKELNDKNMELFDDFRNRYLPNVTKKKYYKSDDFENDFDNIDLFIVGSDQVWNPWVTNIQTDIFFFSFLKPNQARISYAPSFGGSRNWFLSKNKTQKIDNLLNQFDGLSVRDSDSKYIMENIFNKRVEEVLDPTFLIDSYDEILENSDIIGNGSLFSFKFIINDFWINAIKYVAEELDLKINMNACLIPFEGIEYSPICSINDWIALIKTSNFIITDSFHGMVFCIIFKKEFIVTPSYQNGEGRYIDLARKLGLEDRLFFNTKEVINEKNRWINKIDYTEVYKKLDTLKVNSKKFLMTYLTYNEK